MTRLALISPKGPLYKHRGGIFRKSLRASPLTLTTLAALIPEDLKIEVQLIDEGVEDVPDFLEADVVAMTVITGSSMRAYELSEKYRSEGKTVILGGPHVTLIPEEAMQHADSVVVGYAEETWPQLLRDFKRGALKPRYDMQGDFSLQKPENLPFPRRELLKKKQYTTFNTVEATRGCVHSCEFCVVPTAWGRTPFQKPVGHIVDDIRRMSARRVLFYDLNLIANRTYAKELFEALTPLKIKWFGLSTTLLDDDLISRMRQSGCTGLLIGFESLNEESLADSNKGFNKPTGYRELIAKLKQAGILLNGTFVFGQDSDTLRSFKAVEDFVLSAGIDLPRFSILTPFPGTPLFKRLNESGRILTRDWSLYDGQHVVFKPARMSPSELLSAHEALWRKVYSYSSIAKRVGWGLFRKLSLSPLILGANLGYRFYARHLSRFYTCTGGVV